jgi:hypothetical protein
VRTVLRKKAKKIEASDTKSKMKGNTTITQEQQTGSKLGLERCTVFKTFIAAVFHIHCWVW